ncbi:MAG: class I SAM-dependent methyltransferase [Pseudomonadota bacterium]
MQIAESVAAALEARVPLDRERTVLDFGAGTGLLCGHVAPRVARVVAVDISEAMLERLAAKPIMRGRVEICCRNLLEQPLDERFDLIVSTMTMHHVEDTVAVARTFHDHLVPGGRIAIADLDREDGSFHESGTPGVFHRGFDRDALGALFEAAGFADVTFSTACEVERNGGRYPIFLLTASRPT